MKALTEDQFKNSVGAMYSSWSEEYRAAFKKQRPESHVYQYRIKLYDQLKFMKLYLGFLILDGKNKATLNRIKKFLHLQKVISKGIYEIHFLGGSPVEVVVHVNDMKEIDFADTHGLIEFDTIFILRRDKPWIRKNKDETFKAIKNDLQFDGNTFAPASVSILNGDEGNELAFIECGIQ